MRRTILIVSCLAFLWMSLGRRPIGAAEIHDAIRRGENAKAKEIVERDPTQVAIVEESWTEATPLGIAIDFDNEELVQFLLANNADPNRGGANEWQKPILNTDNPRIVKQLLDAGARSDVADDHGSTPLKHAARRGWTDAVKAMVADGAPLDLESAVAIGWIERVAAALAKEPWLAKRPHKLLDTAAGRGDVPLVKLLLQNGADPNLDFGFGNIAGPFTPLSAAITGNHFEVAQILCEHGAKTNVSGGRNHDNLFLYALTYLDVRFTRLLLEHDVDIDARGPWTGGVGPLHVVAALGGAPWVFHVYRVGQPESKPPSKTEIAEKARLLIEFGADVNAAAKDGSTPLLFAAIAGNQEVCDLLIANGAIVDVWSACLLGKRTLVRERIAESPGIVKAEKTPLGRSLLHWSAQQGDSEIVRILLALDANPNAVAPALRFQDAGGFSLSNGDLEPETPLHLAASAGQIDAARLLIEGGADPAALGVYERTPLHRASAAGSDKVAALLLDHGANPNATDKWGMTPLHYATNRNVVDVLLSRGADLNHRGGNGKLPMARAIEGGRMEVAEELCKRGAELDVFCASALNRPFDLERILAADPGQVSTPAQGERRELPILVAARCGAVGAIEVLLRHGATVQPADRKDDVPLHVAAERGHVQLVRFLLEHGQDIDARDWSQRTPLHRACQGSRIDMVAQLIRDHANLDAIDWEGETPMHVIAGRGRYGGHTDNTKERIQRDIAVMELLFAAGAQCDRRDGRGRTPMHCAAEVGNVEVIEWLLKHGRDINPRDNRGLTPLSHALGRRRQNSGRFFVLDRETSVDLLRKHGGLQ